MIDTNTNNSNNIKKQEIERLRKEAREYNVSEGSLQRFIRQTKMNLAIEQLDSDPIVLGK